MQPYKVMSSKNALYFNSLDAGSLNIGLPVVISVRGKPIKRIVGRACHNNLRKESPPNVRYHMFHNYK